MQLEKISFYSRVNSTSLPNSRRALSKIVFEDTEEATGMNNVKTNIDQFYSTSQIRGYPVKYLYAPGNRKLYSWNT